MIRPVIIAATEVFHGGKHLVRVELELDPADAVELLADCDGGRAGDLAPLRALCDQRRKDRSSGDRKARADELAAQLAPKEAPRELAIHPDSDHVSPPARATAPASEPVSPAPIADK